MANHVPGQGPEDVRNNRYPPLHRNQFLPPDQQRPDGEAQSYYDENRSFSSSQAEHGSSHKIYRKRHRHRQNRSRDSPHPSSSSPYAQPTTVDGLAANVPHPALGPGLVGTIKGLYDLAHKKPHVDGHTVQKLELLDRVDRFFNTGFIGKLGGLDKRKTGFFREEREKVSKALRDGGKEQSNAHVESKQSPRNMMYAKCTRSSRIAKRPIGITLPEYRTSAKGTTHSNGTESRSDSMSSSGTDMSSCTTSSSVTRFSSNTNHGAVQR